MTVSQPGTHQLGAQGLSSDWILIFGGVTRSGNRRARRAVETAIERGFDVVWFDGFQEVDTESNSRVPLSVEPVHTLVRIIEFQGAEDETISGRLRLGTGLQKNPFLKTFWRFIGRRLGLILRPRASWRVVKSDVLRLRDHRSPNLIVYGDDYAITSAWYAGRIWPRPRIVAHIPNSQP